MSERDELIIPEGAKEDPNSFELIRIWIANKGQHVALRNVWKDPAAWGLMLCDLARHVANAYQQEEGRDPGETLLRIKAGFDAEFVSPTDKVKGKLED